MIITDADRIAYKACQMAHQAQAGKGIKRMPIKELADLARGFAPAAEASLRAAGLLKS
jgi:hypothetical protein